MKEIQFWQIASLFCLASAGLLDLVGRPNVGAWVSGAILIAIVGCWSED